MKPDFMSSDESVIVSDLDDEDNISDIENLSCLQPKKKLVKHLQAWRSPEFQQYIESLDRKIDRRRTPRARSMVLKVEVGEPSSREAPLDCPDWAKTIFD